MFYEIFWGVLAVFFHRYFLWCWKQERGRENRESFFVCNWLCKRSNELSLWSMSSWCTYNIRVLTVQVTPSPKVVSGGLCSLLPDRPNRHAFHIFPSRFLLWLMRMTFNDQLTYKSVLLLKRKVKIILSWIIWRISLCMSCLIVVMWLRKNFLWFFIKSISEQNIECGYVNRQCP